MMNMPHECLPKGIACALGICMKVVGTSLGFLRNVQGWC